MNPQPLQEFVGEMGLQFEEMGLPRTAGRILGWLLVCDPPAQSLPDLMEALQVSKSNVSTMGRMLLKMGLIERVSFPGDRKDYYRIQEGVWTRSLRTKVVHLGVMRSMAEKGLDLLKDASPAHRIRLQEMREIYAFFEQEYPRLLDRFEEQRNGDSS